MTDENKKSDLRNIYIGDVSFVVWKTDKEWSAGRGCYFPDTVTELRRWIVRYSRASGSETDGERKTKSEIQTHFESDCQ